MTLREQYQQLEKDTQNKYNEIINVSSCDILTKTIKENFDSIADEILEFIDNEGILEAIEHYNIEEVLEEIYYNNSNGIEKMAYLLSVEKGGIYIFDNDLWVDKIINFSDLNGILQKIIVVEVMQEY